MPIYEFYCPKCNLLMDFFSRRVNTETIPNCPHCGTVLSKEVPRISIGAGADASDEYGDSPMDDARMQAAVEAFGDKLNSISDTSNPEEAAAVMKQFSEASGLGFNKDVKEALARIAAGEGEAGANAELDEILSKGEFFAPTDRDMGGLIHTEPPKKDSTMYDM